MVDKQVFKKNQEDKTLFSCTEEESLAEIIKNPLCKILNFIWGTLN